RPGPAALRRCSRTQCDLRKRFPLRRGRGRRRVRGTRYSRSRRSRRRLPAPQCAERPSRTVPPAVRSAQTWMPFSRFSSAVLVQVLQRFVDARVLSATFVNGSPFVEGADEGAYVVLGIADLDVAAAGYPLRNVRNGLREQSLRLFVLLRHGCPSPASPQQFSSRSCSASSMLAYSVRPS